MVQGSKVSARTRARTAQAELLRKRKEHDDLVLVATEAWYSAADAKAAADEALAAAVSEQAKALVQLTGDLGLTFDTVGELCGITAAEVRALVKRGPDGDGA